MTFFPWWFRCVTRRGVVNDGMAVFIFVVVINDVIMLPFEVIGTVAGLAGFVVVVVDNVVVSIL